MDPGPNPPAGTLRGVDSHSRVRRLDGIRGVAVTLVVIYHASYLTAGWGPRLLPGGFVGVDLFFVLSGYLITSLLLTEMHSTGGISLAGFWDRRIRRLVPALAACGVGVAGLLVGTGRVGPGADQLRPAELTRALASTLGYVSNFAQAWGWPFPAELSHTWSLAIEAQFYLVWPLILLALAALRVPRSAQITLVGATMGLVALHRANMWTDQAHYLPLYIRTDTRIDVVLAGCALAMAQHWGYVRSGRWLRVPALVGLGVLAEASLFSETGDVRMYRGFGLTAVALASLTIVASVLLDAQGPLGRGAGWQPLAWLGDRSYSLYLWHVPVFLTVARHIGDTPVILRVVVGVGVSAALTEASYRLVESRLRRGVAATSDRSLTEMIGSWVRGHRGPTLVGALVVGAFPMAVAVVSLGQVTWYPIGDLAQAMLRQFSFWSDPPLVGPAGRIGTFERQGNHPGPAMFWATWPLWWLLGRSSWAYQASVATLVVGAYAAAAALVRRTQGWAAALAVAVVGAVLMRSYGAVALTQPWNPYVPLLPFLLFVVAAWAVSSGRWSMLPVAVAVGSFCVQCHVGYAPAVVAGVGGAMILALLGNRILPASGGGSSPAASGASSVGWVVVAVLVGVIVWIPPVIDQLRHDPGNFSILLDTYRAQTTEVIGVRAGTRIWLTQLDPVGNWLLGTRRISGSVVPGLVLLMAWAGSLLVAWRRRLGSLVRLDLVLAGLVVCAWYWAVRLDSTRFLYLVEWFWVLTAMITVSTIWGWWVELSARRPRWADERAPVVAALAVLVLSTVSFTWTATGVQPPDMRYSRTVEALAPEVEAALDPSDTYLMTWVDPDALGGNGFGLMAELERRGFRVGAAPARSAPVEPHRVLTTGQYDRVITVVSGDDKIALARTMPRARELAYDDHRSAAERAEYRMLQREVMDELRTRGLGEVADGIPVSIWIGLNDPRVTGAPFDKLARMLVIGQATAVFESSQELVGL